MKFKVYFAERKSAAQQHNSCDNCAGGLRIFEIGINWHINHNPININNHEK